MNWDFFVAWTKKFGRNRGLPVAALDKKLVHTIHNRIFPRWSQLKYVPSFLSRAEKRLVVASLCIVSITAVLWGAAAIFRHMEAIPADGGEYSEGLIGQPKYINPIFSVTNDVDADLTALMYAGLFSYNKSQELSPYLAESYTVSDDGKTYDIKLRSDAYWSDNEPVTADDVVFTFETIQNPEVGSPLFPAFQGVTVQKIDDRTVRFTLKQPFAPFLDSLTVGILPEHIWSDIPSANLKLAKNNLQPVGAGPWVFSKLSKDGLGNIQSYSLVRNEHFFGPKPHFQMVTFKFYNDYSQAFEALRSQNILGLSFLPADEKKLSNKNLIRYTLHLPEYTALFFNQTKQPALKSLNTRTALAAALDKNTVLADVLNSAATIVGGPILPGQLGFDASSTGPNFDVVTANELLDKDWDRIEPENYFQLRYAELTAPTQPVAAPTPTKKSKKNTSSDTQPADSQQPTATSTPLNEELVQMIRQEMDPSQTFYRKNKNGDILAITITTADTPEYKQIAENIATAWRKVGVKTNLLLVNPHQITREVIKPREYDVLLYAEIIGNDPDPFPFWHSSQIEYPGLNLSLYSDRTVDKMLEDARATTDVAKRSALYQKFQSSLLADVPAIFLYSPSYTFVAESSVKGINLGQLTTPTDRFNDLSNWYLKTSWRWKKS